jgi:pimeloyl-ACP methyl ester carboxylesterase
MTTNENMHFSVFGDGQPAVLIHGIAASNYDWIYLTPVLTQLGYRVCAPDLVGHGYSTKPEDPELYTFNILYEHFTGWVEEACQFGELTLIGHSLGGLIALNYAINNPGSVSKIILIDPYYNQDQLNSALQWIKFKPEWYQKVLNITPLWLIHAIINLDVKGQIQFDGNTRQQIADDYKRASPLIMHVPGSIPDISDRIETVESPTLVVWGTDDATLKPESFAKLVSALPHGQGKPIQGAGHQPHLSKPEMFNNLVKDFLLN